MAGDMTIFCSGFFSVFFFFFVFSRFIDMEIDVESSVTVFVQYARLRGVRVGHDVLLLLRVDLWRHPLLICFSLFFWLSSVDLFGISCLSPFCVCLTGSWWFLPAWLWVSFRPLKNSKNQLTWLSSTWRDWSSFGSQWNSFSGKRTRFHSCYFSFLSSAFLQFLGLLAFYHPKII